MNNQVDHPILKAAASIGSAIFAGMTPQEWAAVACAILNGLFILDWLWKRVGKALVYHMRGRTGKPRQFMDSTIKGEL